MFEFDFSLPAEELADRIAEFHRIKLMRDGEIPPAIVFRAPGKGETMLPMGWRSAQERSHKLAVLRTIFKVASVDRYATWSEMWLGHVTQAQMDADDFVMPRDQPDRIEGVMTLVVYKWQAPITRVDKIVRAPDGAISGLEPMAPPDGITGALATLMGGQN